MESPPVSSRVRPPSNRPSRESNELRRRLGEVTDEARHNETVLRHFHNRELLLLTAPDLPELLARLTVGMREAFSLDGVSLFVQDPEHEIRDLLAQVSVLPGRDLQLVDSLAQVSPLLARLKQPWLGTCQMPEHAALLMKPAGICSLAALPLRLGERLLGGLVLASRDPTRYTRHHGTEFLHHLSVVAAVCLENVVNRERLRLTSLTDPLTGLYNRRFLEDRMGQEMARTARYGQSLSCLFLDLDHFKGINDRHGHPAGDAVLRQVAARARDMLRASDIATRYGGEEFAVVLPQTGWQEAVRLAERIRTALADTPMILPDGGTLNLTCSVGVSEARPPSQPADPDGLARELLAQADAALYRAKQGGRNRVVCDGHPVP